MKIKIQRSVFQQNFKARFLLTLTIVFCLTIRTQAIVVFVNQNFYSAGGKMAVSELNIKVPLNSLKGEKTGDKYRSSVKISYSYLNGIDTVVSDIFYLMSPLLNDTFNPDKALAGSYRINLPMGKYLFYLHIEDEYDSENSSAIYAQVTIDFPDEILTFSKIQLADTFYPAAIENMFVKNNYLVTPNILNAYPASASSLFFYAEFYHADKFISDSTAYIQYSILKGDQPVSTKKLLKLKIQDKNFVVGKIEIEKLPPGKYKLMVKLISRHNKKLASEDIDFTIFSPLQPLFPTGDLKLMSLLSQYSLSQLLVSLEYMSSLYAEKETFHYELLKKSADSSKIIEFINDFWTARFPDNAYQGWKSYLDLVEESNRLFTTQLREGYLTDRGRVYVQYGPPNQVVDASDPSIAYPYQIWQYYKLADNQSNQKFVFFNKTGALDEFELLHSTARGEPKNPNWKNVINKFNNNNNFQKGLFGDYLDKDFDQ